METNILRDRALKRIKALLNKTEENGASLEEAKSALEKATILMKEYFITLNDIEDLKDDPIVVESTPIIKIKEDIGQLYPIICKLFDLRHFFSSSSLTFVGYQTDVKIGIYLYNKIVKGLLKDLDDFKKSDRFSKLKINYHGSTLRRDFISGWIDAIYWKVEALYSERESKINTDNKGGLILLKKDNVDKKFSEFKVKLARSKSVNVFSSAAFTDGTSSASKFNLQNDLDTTEDNLKTIGYE